MAFYFMWYKLPCMFTNTSHKILITDRKLKIFDSYVYVKFLIEMLLF